MSVGLVDQGSTENGDMDGLGVEDLGVTEYYSKERLLNILPYYPAYKRMRLYW